MGFFKGMKDMREGVAGAPGAIRDAQAAAAQAQEMMAARNAVANQEAQQMIQLADGKLTESAAGADLSPIAGVSLEQYAAVAKGLAQVGFDQSQAAQIATSKGVSAGSWDQAMTGWNERITQNASIGKQFNDFYAGA